MKIQTKSQTQGSVLLVTLLTASIIGVALGSYLTLTSNQHQSVYRSNIWNEAIPVAEAGVEDALAHIYYHGITNYSVDDWTWGTDGCYHKQRFIGTEGAYYDVAVMPVDPPVITATSYVRTPFTQSSAFGMILGVANSGSTRVSYIKRRVQVKTIMHSGFDAPIVAKGIIDFSGQNVQTDGFNSRDPNYSTNGMYDPNPAKTKPIGDVRSNVGAGRDDAINLGNADIKGHVTTGPNGVVVVGSGGSVGDVAWVDSGTQGIQPGYRYDDSNMEILDVKEPFSGGYFTPVGGTVDGVNYNYVLDQQGNYKLSSLGGKVLVTGDATLWVTDSFSLSGNDYIKIAPGAKLKLYVSAATATLGGKGIINGNGAVDSFQYFGLPSNTAFDFKANASYTGTVYAPQADFSLGGGGNDAYDFVGACVVNSIKLNGHIHFHYDEDIRRLIPGPYLAASWNEIDPN
jgi:hypothetical protein